MKVKGTVVINFEVDVDVDDISTESMDMYESDLLLTKAIEKKYKVSVENDIHVYDWGYQDK